MADQPADTFQTFDADSLATLARLIAGHRQAVLATLDAGAPYTAMVAYVPERGFAGLLIHLSDLSAHKRHLRADPRASLIIFEPDNGRTEILQHARVSLGCTTEIIPKDTDAYTAAKDHYLARFPSHKLMFTLKRYFRGFLGVIVQRLGRGRCRWSRKGRGGAESRSARARAA